MFCEADIMYFSFFGIRTLLTWIFWPGSAKVPQQQRHLRLIGKPISSDNITISGSVPGSRFGYCTTSPWYHQIISILQPQVNSTPETEWILLTIPSQLGRFNLSLVGTTGCSNEYRTLQLRHNLMNKLIQRDNSMSDTTAQPQTFPYRPRNIKHNAITNSHNT